MAGTAYYVDIYEYSLPSQCYLSPALTGKVTTTGSTATSELTNAQWTWQNPSPSGNLLYKVDYVTSTQGWAVGEHGTILATKDGGRTWDSQNSGTTTDLMAVSFSDIENGTAVGGWADWNGNSSSLILRTTDGGKNWIQQASGVSNYLYNVCFTDPNRGTAVGSYGTILRTTDGGNTWVKQSSGTTYNLYGISFTDSINGTAVGEGGTILKTTNGGDTWILQSSGVSKTLMSVSFFDANNGLVAGHEGTILKTSDGGATWIKQLSGTTMPLYGTSINDKNTGVIVGGGSVILTTTNGGANWAMQTAKPNDLFGVSFSDANNGIAVGGNKFEAQSLIILKTADGGKTWIEKSRAVTGKYLKDVSFADTNTGMIVGSQGTIINSRDGGNTWQSQITGTTTDIEDIEPIDANNWIAVGAKFIFRTSNGGKTWTSQSPQPTDKWYNFNSVFFTDAKNGIVVGSEWDGDQGVALILRTADGGEKWERIACEGYDRLESVFFVDKNNGFAVGQLPMNGGQYYYGLILRTTDGGITWTLQPNNITHGLGKVYFKDSKNGFILTDHFNIVRTTDGGNTWFEQSVGTTSFKSDIFFTDSINGTILSSPDILKTNDGGNTWVKQPIGTKNNLTGMYFFDAANGIVVGQGGTILKTSGPACQLPLIAEKINGNTMVCPNESSEIYSVAAIPHAENYSWSYSGTGVTIMNGTTNSIYIIFSPDATSGILTVNGKNSCGNGPVSSMEISVNPTPQSAGKITGVTRVNQGQNTVTYTVPEIVNATLYIWTLPTGATGTSTTNTITVNYGMSAVSGNITVKGHNNCHDGEMSSLPIEVNNAPIAVAGENKSVDEKTTISLDGTASTDPDGNTLTYKWIAPPGISLSSPSEANPSFMAPDIKNDSIIVFMLIVNDGIIDSNPSSVIITLKKVTNTGTDVSTINGISVYPNPIKNELFIEKKGNTGKINFVIVNAAGQVVFKGKLTDKTIVPTGHFTPGVYLIKLENGQTFKIIK